MVTVAFFLAPLAAPVSIWAVFSALYLLGIGWFAGKEYAVVLSSVWLFGFFSTPVAYMVTLIGAVPTYLLVRRRWCLRCIHCLFFGGSLGALPFLGFDLYIVVFELSRAVSWGWNDPFFGGAQTLSGLLEQVPAALAWLGLGTTCGAVTGACFWAIGIRANRRLATP